jgi:hypothetical protein
VKKIRKYVGNSYFLIFYEIGDKWLMIHNRFKFTIYDLSSYELKTIIQSKIDSDAEYFNAYG